MISYTLERSSLKTTPLRVVFFQLSSGVSSGDETLRLMLDILHQKEKSLRWAINSCFFPSQRQGLPYTEHKGSRAENLQRPL